MTPSSSTGYTRPLYLLPFDHRASFQSGMFGWTGELTADQAARIAASKQVIYEGFKAAVKMGVPKDRAGILVDEQFGQSILSDANRNGFITAASVEMSGEQEFDFEYGADFARHIETINPTFCKVLVRFNPEGDQAMNARQANRLHKLSKYLQAHDRLFMFELLVPAERAQLERLHRDRTAYDLTLRPGLQVRAIRELQDAGIEPDVWKIEGVARAEDARAVVDAARRNGRAQVGCIVLGRGESEQHVNNWLRVAREVPGFIGFAVGRSTFWEPLLGWRDGRLTVTEAAAHIAARYREWVQIFEVGHDQLEGA